MSKYTAEHAYGWVKDTTDIRDHVVALGAPVKLPPAVDLRPSCPPIYDQGQLGSCTANALSAAYDVERHIQGLGFLSPSRLFVYFNERMVEHTIMSDSGAQIRDGVKVLNAYGVVPETEWPYDPSVFTRKPSAQVYADAHKNLALDYARVPQDLKSMQTVLAGGHPIVIGFSVYSSFESQAVATTGIVPMPAKGDTLLGGHAVLIVGYQKVKGKLHFLVRNSWGPDWGIAGCFLIPVEYYTNDDLASDAWVIKAVEA